MQIASRQLPDPPRLLVIDDEPGVREGCRRVLTEEGYAVQVADSGEAGLALLQQQEFELVFVDIKMPGMGGLGFLAAAAELQRETAYVVITAYATLSMAVDATKRGAHDFVAKPFTPDELLNVTRQALEHVQLVRERNRLYQERAQRLLELATEKGRLRTIVEAMTEGVLVTNREYQVVLYNAAATALTGCSPNLTEPVTVQSCVHFPDLVSTIEEAQNAPAVRQHTREIRIGPQEHDVVMASVSPVLDHQGECLGVVTVLNDVSELKKVELVKAQFVNMVAHELRAPLAAVDSSLMAILEGFATDPAQQRQLLDRAHARLQALLELVSDLLAISRMDARTTVREIRNVDVGELAGEICDLMQPVAAERGIKLDLECPAALPLLEADHQELSAILTNLLSNAIKYNRADGEVHLGLRVEGPNLVLTVADTGVGISPQGKQRIFDEFFREKTAANSQVTGTGLGLAIVKRLVQANHGTLEVTSELGQGSCFTIRLPLTASTGGHS